MYVSLDLYYLEKFEFRLGLTKLADHLPHYLLNMIGLM